MENQDEVIDETLETTDDETTTEETSTEETSTTNEESEETTELPDYRQAAPEAEERTSKNDTVPLAKHMAVKSEIKELRKELESLKSNSGNKEINSTDLDSLAEEFDLEPTFVKKLASTMIGLTQAQLEAKIAPIMQERQAKAADAAFEEDFNKTILSKYPELADKKAEFKRFAFSPDFLHLKSLDDIRKNYFGSATAQAPAEKKETVEGGSMASLKSEQIDFANMDEATHLKVLKDPKAREKYFQWQEEREDN